MDLEKSGNLPYAINEIFRHMHTIKGNSMMMMYDQVAELAHTLEDLFDYLRKNPEVTPNFKVLTDLVLDALDFTKGEVESLSSNGAMNGKADVLRGNIKEFLSSLQFMNPEAAPPETKSTVDNQKYFIAPAGSSAKPQEESTESIHFYAVHIRFEEGCEMENVRAFSIVHQFKDMTEEIIHQPANLIEDDQAGQTIKDAGFQMALVTGMDLVTFEGHMAKVAFIEPAEIVEIDATTYMELNSGDKSYQMIFDNSAEVTVEVASQLSTDDVTLETAEIILKPEEMVLEPEEHIPVKADLPPKEEIPQKKVAAQQNPQSSGQTGSGGYINVAINKADKLMDLIGELVVSESMVTKNPDLHGLELDNFNKASRQLRIVINELQDLIMSIRMVPLTLTFQKMSRIVRDMSNKLDKDIELTLIGEETEVDKNVIERIADPLMHIIRNSIDHGIEDKESRLQTGKPLKGSVTLEARHSGGDVWISIKDDGKGLDRNKILAKASEKGLLIKPHEEYTDREAYHMIFHPGFSTKEQITEFSGRGVGLDVVTRNIEELGGSVLVDSTVGKGSDFSLKIPLTLAIMDGMMIQVGESIFTVPIISIKDSFNIKQKEILIDPDGNEMVMVRGECLPIVRLHHRFALDTPVKELTKGILTMVEYDGRSALLFADAILGEQQVVVKPLSKFMRKIKGISGCALLGDGRISLILDPSGIVNG